MGHRVVLGRRHGDEGLHRLCRTRLQRVVVEIPSGRHHHGQGQDDEHRPAPVASPAPRIGCRGAGGHRTVVHGDPRHGRGRRVGGRSGGVGVATVLYRRQVVVVLGHSGGVVAPEPSDPPAARTWSGDAAMKPAMEPTDTDVTGPMDPQAADRRRRVALAGHTGPESDARQGLADASSSVRATALGALARLGALTDDDLRVALADPAPSVRRRAVRAGRGSARGGDRRCLDDEEPSVVEMAAWSLGEREERSAVHALSLLAAVGSGHRDPLCREAAVAALGAIGDTAACLPCSRRLTTSQPSAAGPRWRSPLLKDHGRRGTAAVP